MAIVTVRRAALAALASTVLSGTSNAQDISAINGSNALTVVSSNAPTTVRRTLPITGLGAGQSLVAIDGRPAANGRILYAISNVGQLYSINPMTGGASAVGTPIALQGSAFGFDFNPTVDRIRIVSNSGQNLRVNPDTGAVIVDGSLNVLVGPVPVGVNGNTAAAYTNNFAGATTTTLYVINTQTGAFQIQNPPNNGTLSTAGGIGGLAAGTVSGFDIARTGEARLSVTQSGVTNLFSVNLQTGVATLLGAFGAPGPYMGLAYLPVAFGDISGLTPNQLAVARTLDNFTSVSPGFVPLLTAIDLLPDNAARADAFSQLGPRDYGILPDVILQTNEFVDGTLRRNLRDVRGGVRRGEDGNSFYNDRKIGGFLIAGGRVGDFEARGDRGEMDYGSAGVMAGIDFRLSPTALIGIAGGYDSSTVRLNAISTNSEAETWFVGGYGTAGFGPLFVDITGSYGKTDFDLSRNVAFGTFSSNNRSLTEGRYYAASATIGAKLEFGSIEAEPYVGARYADVRVRSFGEGAGLTNLNVGSQDLESLQSVAGLRIGAVYSMGGANIRPSIYGEYRHEFRNDDPRTLVASFSGGGISTPFNTVTAPFGDDYYIAGAELAIAGDGPVEVVMDYKGQFSGGYKIHALQGGLRVRF